MKADNNPFGDLIFGYSRAQAIEDGVLVDVSQWSESKENGFKIPVAITRQVWDQYVEVPEGVACQDLNGRLWDVLYMLRMAVLKRAAQVDVIYFDLHVRNNNRQGMPPRVTLKAVCGPGDQNEPVITIMMPDED